MAILDSYTKIPAGQTVGEISELLAQAKALAVLQEFDDAGELAAINFRIRTEFGILTFRLPAETEKVFSIIQKEREIPPRFRTRKHARNVAWRMILHWLQAQLALIRAGLVVIEQVFLPYAQGPDGKTLFENLQSFRFKGFALPENTEN
jgi:hypothetical protein